MLNLAQVFKPLTDGVDSRCHLSLGHHVMLGHYSCGSYTVRISICTDEVLTKSPKHYRVTSTVQSLPYVCDTMDVLDYLTKLTLNHKLIRILELNDHAFLNCLICAHGHELAACCVTLEGVFVITSTCTTSIQTALQQQQDHWEVTAQGCQQTQIQQPQTQQIQLVPAVPASATVQQIASTQPFVSTDSPYFCM
ncbi:hypothetical protein NPIL_474021 [Nephila pilipes]|uniref:Uncharacterized protein n=1 Tax=Nephila pilipes TaxID=299642 RepID=A0A8X6NPL1_NEPPI|nr:hypothetical protein NPIL_474021 [Nephila pilipes]